ncbi:MAG: ATP-binding cassette domain-containing protein [Flavobacteriales bacterium]|nr:MAG: ATP-binding cassette domain-containing protein [Flavobacteriales bacterium]
MTAPLLSVQQLGFGYGEREVLTGVDLSLAQKETLVLTGASGCGKSTLLRLIAGLEKPRYGTIELNGAMISSPSSVVPTEQRPIGMVFQGLALFPHLTVEGNIAFGLRHLPKTQRRGTVNEYLDLLGLEGLGERFPNEISGGQQQRVAVARSLARKPQLLLMDEPFSDLDLSTRVNVREAVKTALQRSGTAAIIVSHDQQDAEHMAHRIVRMESGRLVEQSIVGA